MTPNAIDNENTSTKDNTQSPINDIPAENSPKQFKVRQYIPLIFISVVILLCVCIFSTIFALVNYNNSKIVNGVFVNGINLSGLTYDESTEKLSKEFSNKLNSAVTLTYNEYKCELIPSKDIDANFNISAAADMAYSIGRSGNLLENNYEILASLISSKKITISLEYSKQKLDNYIDNISTELPGLVKHPSYYIENDELIIVKGISGIELLKEDTKNLIISNIESLSSSNTINLPIQNANPSPIDIDKIYEEIYSEPENAYFCKEPFELKIDSPGIDFAIPIDEAKALLQEDKDEYIIPLKITPPEISIEDLGNDIFPDNLGTYSSYYNTDNINRTTNVEIASNKINNVILLPGEEFSYNKVVGERTIENGFKEASVYTSLGVVDGLGGGICQVSSTLYNAVLDANLKILERKNHRYAVSYVPLGRDATVAYGSIDFRFKNTRNYPIKIISSTKKRNSEN